jgi:glycine cleavage system transcriptional repressor
MTEFDVNITNLQFVSGSRAFPDKAVTIYEVDIPTRVKLSEFVAALTARAAEVGLEVNVQHMKIFEDICRL